MFEVSYKLPGGDFGVEDGYCVLGLKNQALCDGLKLKDEEHGLGLRTTPGSMDHPSDKVQSALTQLCDALCSWERSTGRMSALILKEQGGYAFRASSGKPSHCSISDSEFIELETGT